MHTTSYAEARKNFSAAIASVCVDYERTVITRTHGRAVVLLALDDYKAREQIVKGSADGTAIGATLI